MSEPQFSAIVLAAGKGTRMKSNLPKVLHPVAGRPMILRSLVALKQLGAQEVRVVVGHGEELVRKIVEPLGGVCHRQESQLGTGDAVRSAKPESLKGPVLILNGDHPLLGAKDLEMILEAHHKASSSLSVVTAKLSDPGAFGRICRSSSGEVEEIVEAKDASPEVLNLNEVNTGIYVADSALLKERLDELNADNKQGEFYLTDIVKNQVGSGGKVLGIVASESVAFGVNSQRELAQATKKIYLEKAEALMDEGVIVIDPDHCYIESSVRVGSGSIISPGVHLRGRTELGRGCYIEPNCVIDDSRVGDGTRVYVGSCLSQSQVGEFCEIGPYARLRPLSDIGPNCKIGNFVETKKMKMGEGSKASHLAYLGDAEIGKNVNIGCGAITVNYAVDRKKYLTEIEDDAFIGSDSQLVAPVKVGKGAVVASGSTITKSVPAGALAVARGRQITKENYTPRSSSSEADS